MVREQLAARDIRDPRVLNAMGRVPRHEFVPVEVRHQAYEDGPLPIGAAQTISQPYVVGLMTQLLDLVEGERVLEIGTGSGYQAAVLSLLAGEIYTVERVPALADKARDVLQRLGYTNVHVTCTDGSGGLPEFAPYDAILLTAAAPRITASLARQLADEGRLLAPVGGERGQVLHFIRRRGDRFRRSKLVPVAFVPLRGKGGWSEEDWEPNRGP